MAANEAREARKASLCACAMPTRASIRSRASGMEEAEPVQVVVDGSGIPPPSVDPSPPPLFQAAILGRTPRRAARLLPPSMLAAHLLVTLHLLQPIPLRRKSGVGPPSEHSRSPTPGIQHLHPTTLLRRRPRRHGISKYAA
ncbi:hypothetical protein L1887_48638 [Cichorium endivia]|nr:hypothetical protein L1887_48638 [Cichorium endivia]